MLYTIRIDNVDEFEGTDPGAEITRLVKEKIEPEGLTIRGIGLIPHTDDLFVMIGAESMEPRRRPPNKHKDKMLTGRDWGVVNNAINDVLDDLNFVAHVRSKNIFIRQGKKRLV